MARFSDIRRHSDGSIDFDFYRRRARRERQLARQAAVSAALSALRHATGDFIRAAARSIGALSRPRNGRHQDEPAPARVRKAG